MNNFAVNADTAFPRADSQAAIEIDNLTVSYGSNQILRGLNLQVPRGSIYGLLGANGAGKTTLIKTLLGIRTPDKGHVRVLGFEAVKQRQEISARVGYVSESSNFYEYLNVKELCLLCRKTQRHWNQDKVDHYLQLFALPGKKTLRKFSKGMKTQLALCLSLGNEPDLLLLDEPTEGLDPLAREVFLNILINEVAASGTTIFFSSHVIPEIAAIADHVAIVYEGKIVLSDELDNLRSSHKILLLAYSEKLPEQEIEALQNLPGVLRLEQEGRHIRLRVKSDVHTVLVKSIKARPYELRDIEIVPARLDHILLDYLKGGVQ
ncbi:ABC transporter ATP-binding protein [Ktedonosporobacter rubrisoli]|uniref:ABC transporter ATP-binding protein n=1 Tax=Ktedonosporobacter rubrisoli TaxID=2509675 RepID=A0A4P6JWX6_KTERU|nr:ABC transporter ATP-binding protein [Ktedonosporobacter rubrisoli]QBD80229.1 ABC transporter ATP-binding protein [Ktedonosporobacter rubrisoli]